MDTSNEIENVDDVIDIKPDPLDIVMENPLQYVVGAGCIKVEPIDTKYSDGEENFHNIDDTKVENDEYYEFNNLSNEKDIPTTRTLRKRGKVKKRKVTPRRNKSKNDVLDSSLNTEAKRDASGHWCCNRCGLRYMKKNSLVYHLKREHNVSFQEFNFHCSHCGLEYSSRESLRVHTKRNHSEIEKKREVNDSEHADSYIFEHGIWFCAICGSSYTKRNSLSNHLIQQHNLDLGGFKFKCKLCGVKYNCNDSLRVHVNRKHGYPNKVKSDFEQASAGELSMKQTQSDMIVLEHGLWCCKKCGIRYAKKNMAIYHLRRNHGLIMDFKFKCKICKLDFFTEEGLNRHIKRKHKINTIYPVKSNNQCTDCGASFRFEKNLVMHIKNKHSDEFKIETADDLIEKEEFDDEPLSILKAKMVKDNLNDESKIKIDCEEIVSKINGDLSDTKEDFIGDDLKSETEYNDEGMIDSMRQCNACGNILSSGKNLMDHIQNAHPVEYDAIIQDLEAPDEEENYGCLICGEKFSNMSVLQKHVKLKHTNKKSITDSFKCEFCKYITSSYEIFQLHLKTIHEHNIDSESSKRNQLPYLWSCKECVLNFPTMTELFQHVENAHNGQKTVKSDYGNSKTDGCYECNHCSIKFTSRNDIIKHLTEKHLDAKGNHNDSETENSNTQDDDFTDEIDEKLDQTNKHECTLCGLILDNKEFLKLHLKAKHFQMYENLRCAAGEDDIIKPELKFNCVLCDKRYSNISSLRFHIKNAHNMSNGRKNLSCGYCSSVFLTQDKLKSHYDTVHWNKKVEKNIPLVDDNASFEVIIVDVDAIGELRQKETVLTETNSDNPPEDILKEKHLAFKCKLCDIVVKNKPAIIRHLYIKHSDPNLKPFECPFCEYKSKTKWYLNNHLSSKHPDTELAQKKHNFICDKCGYITNNMSTFKNHVRSHKIRYQCEFCDYSTSLKTSIVVHRRKHTKQKPFKCSFEGCTYSCTQKSALNIHIFNHYPEKYMRTCHICGYKTVNKYAMNNHIKEHKNGRSCYTCLQCPYVTYEKTNFSTHASKHQEAKKCHLCEFSTKYNQTMRRHLKVRHGVDTPKRTRTNWRQLQTSSSVTTEVKET